jgi:hypothetical protein
MSKNPKEDMEKAVENAKALLKNEGEVEITRFKEDTNSNNLDGAE